MKELAENAEQGRKNYNIAHNMKKANPSVLIREIVKERIGLEARYKDDSLTF